MQVIGDPKLAAVLRAAGFDLVGPGSADDTPEMVLVAIAGAGAAEERRALELVRRAIPAAVLVGAPPRRRHVRAPRLAHALAIASAPAGARRAARAVARVVPMLEAAGLAPAVIPLGDRATVFAIGDEGGFGRRLAGSAVVVGGQGEPRPSVIDVAAEAAAAACDMALAKRRVLVLESAKLLVELEGPDGSRFAQRISGRPGGDLVRSAAEVLRALGAAGPSAAVSSRVPWPLCHGDVGLAHQSVEAWVTGSPARRLTSRLWDACLEFLVELHGLRHRPDEPNSDAETAIERAASVLGRHVGPQPRAQLDVIAQRAAGLTAGLPLGFSHGDFWYDNLLVHDGRLAAVLDWDWATTHAPPMFDLFDLLAASSWHSGGLAPGPRMVRAVWPLVTAASDERLRAYGAAVGVAAEPAVLQALAVAYWLDRVARDLRPLTERAKSRRWIDANINAPLRHLADQGWR